MDFSPVREGDEAGLTVFMNRRHHYEIAVAKEGAGRCILLRRRIGELSAVTARSPIPEGKVILEIQAETGRYSFYYGTMDMEPQLLGTGETRYLSTEVAGGFTGVYFAMYAASASGAGSGSPAGAAAAGAPAARSSASAAYFDWFEYLPVNRSQG